MIFFALGIVGIEVEVLTKFVDWGGDDTITSTHHANTITTTMIINK